MTRFAWLCCLVAAGTVWAHEYTKGDVRIEHPYARVTPAGARTGAAYLRLENSGRSADKLLRASSPRAGSVEMHRMSMEGNIMRMRQIPAIDLAPGAEVNMAPGGVHLMLIDLKQPLKQGDRVPMTLVFASAGEVKVEVVVQDAAPSSPQPQHQGHKH